MKLIEIVDRLGAFDQTQTIYAAEPWTEDSACMVDYQPHGEHLPEEVRACGMKYFLDVWSARKFCEDWAASSFHEPTLLQKCAFLVQFTKDISKRQ